MKSMLTSIVLSSAFAAQATLPVVDDATISMAVGKRTVEITYSLSGAPGIVTFDVETNVVDAADNETWASIGYENIHHAVGDVFRLVDEGENRKIYWCAEKSWPNRTIASPDDIRVKVKVAPTNNPPDYMVSDLISGDRWYYDAEAQLPGGIDSDDYRKHLFLMRKIPARGKVMRLGTNPVQASYDESRDRQVSVAFTNDFYMGVFEVTQWQYFYAVKRGGFTPATGVHVPSFPGDTRPLDCGGYGSDSNLRNDYGVLGTLYPPRGIWSQYDHNPPWPNGTDEDFGEVAEESLLGQLRILTGLGKLLHAPTQWQWEFACRAGCNAEFCDGGSVSNANETVNSSLDKLGRYRGNGGYIDNGDGTYTAPEAGTTSTEVGTARVGSYAPNAWGLYDMHGNVKEWCRDYRSGSVDGQFDQGDIVYFDPIGETSATAVSTQFNCRGGDWQSLPAACTSGQRGNAIQVYQEQANCCGIRLCYIIR